jgi:hypothetical protein
MERDTLYPASNIAKRWTQLMIGGSVFHAAFVQKINPQVFLVFVF